MPNGIPELKPIIFRIFAKNIKMAKEFKRKTDKGKRPFGSQKEGGEERKSAPESKSFPSKDRKDKRDAKPAFERFRDESRPSDFGTSKPKSDGRTGDFKKRKPAEEGRFNKKEFTKKDDSFDKKKTERSAKPYNKKPFSKESGPIKKSVQANPYDLDEKDFAYEKPKTTFSGEKGKGFLRGVPSGKGRGYEKKPYVKKTWTNKSAPAKKSREEDDGSMRLNKYIANAGICSRREADDLISSGVVQVNGKTITEMGYRVKPTDIIKYGGQTLKKERLVYLILNKPKDYITTADDPQKRRTVLELIAGACKERIYPVGRLDRATTGLLMFTNDGDLTKKLTHPKYGVRKIYHVELDKPLKRADMDKIIEGLELEDGPIKVDEISYVANGVDKTQVGVEIHSGKNRIVRRIFEHMGYNVRKLDRVMFGSLTKKDMARGRWRFLTDAEVGMLKMISTEKE